jgi:hypothetical protein
MWDILMTIGNLAFVPALWQSVRDRRTFVARKTSGLIVIGMVAVIAGLVGSGLYLTSAIGSVVGAMWLFVFLFRHKPGVIEPVEVPEAPPAVHAELPEEASV